MFGSAYTVRRNDKVLLREPQFIDAWHQLMAMLHSQPIVGCHLDNPPGRSASATITVRLNDQTLTYTIEQE